MGQDAGAWGTGTSSDLRVTHIIVHNLGLIEYKHPFGVGGGGATAAAVVVAMVVVDTMVDLP